MITRITGKLLRLDQESAVLAAAPFEYEVYIPDFVRRQLQTQLGQEVGLFTIHYLEGDPSRGKVSPRLVGFSSEIEREFFELFCSVDGVGVKKALRAMGRPVQDIAVLIEEQDAKGLSGLPGVGPATADRIIAKLRRKMSKFALLVMREQAQTADVEHSVVDECFSVLRQLGHSEADARKLIDTALKAKKKYSDVETLLHAIYQQKHGGEAE
jgi:Holliday junction DNA helicase RuvA